MSISDIQVLLGPVAEKFFPGEGNLKLTEVYQEIMDLELEQIEPLIKDVTRKFNKAGTSFSETDSAEQEFLQKFAFICMLSFDVYVKKQVIENLIDQMAPSSQDSDKHEKTLAQKFQKRLLYKKLSIFGRLSFIQQPLLYNRIGILAFYFHFSSSILSNTIS